MQYNNLYSDFAALFKDKTDRLEQLAFDANADTNDGMHVMFSFVVIPFILELLKSDDTTRLKVAFKYFEKMAESKSADITEVLEFTVLENLAVSDPEIYRKAKKYMGHATLECCKNVERFFDTTT